MPSTDQKAIFGLPTPQHLTAADKADILRRAEAYVRPTAPGRHYGRLAAKAFAVLKALLLVFHSNQRGCYPSYETIAAKVGCAPSTVHTALQQLADVGILVWQHGLKRIEIAAQGSEQAASLVTKLVRTSNRYVFKRPPPAPKPPERRTKPKPDVRGERRVSSNNPVAARAKPTFLPLSGAAEEVAKRLSEDANELMMKLDRWGGFVKGRRTPQEARLGPFSPSDRPRKGRQRAFVGLGREPDPQPAQPEGARGAPGSLCPVA